MCSLNSVLVWPSNCRGFFIGYCMLKPVLLLNTHSFITVCNVCCCFSLWWKLSLCARIIGAMPCLSVCACVYVCACVSACACVCLLARCHIPLTAVSIVNTFVRWLLRRPASTAFSAHTASSSFQHQWSSRQVRNRDKSVTLQSQMVGGATGVTMNCV